MGERPRGSTIDGVEPLRSHYQRHEPNKSERRDTGSRTAIIHSACTAHRSLLRAGVSYICREFHLLPGCSRLYIQSLPWEPSPSPTTTVLLVAIGCTIESSQEANGIPGIY